MIIDMVKQEIEKLERDKEALSYKQHWTGEDYANNRFIRDKLYKLYQAEAVLEKKYKNYKRD